MDTEAAIYHEVQEEERYKKRSALLTALLLFLLILGLILPFLSYPIPPPGQEGILVNLGIPELGSGAENAASAALPIEEEVQQPDRAEEPEEVVEEPVEPTPEEPEEVVEEVTKSEAVPEPEAIEEPQPDPELIRQQEAAIALKKQKEAEAKQKAEARQRKKKAEALAEQEARKKKAAAEAAAKKRQAEIAAAKAAKVKAAKAKAAALRESTAGLFGGNTGSGDGKGDTGKPGNQGDPNGDPDADNLRGLSTGAGRISGGLSGRGYKGSAKVSDNSQKTGTVVVSVCVNSAGIVTKAEKTLRGSTTDDLELVRKAIKNAKTYRFSKSERDIQCGQITYNFRVK